MKYLSLVVEAGMELVQPCLLITDDDRSFRETLSEVLVRRGFETVLADSGEEAVSLVKKQAVHLAMVDMHMPKWSGLETLARLQEFTVGLPCILMSAQLDASIVQRAQELKAASVVSKPFSMQFIIETVQGILEQRYGR